MFLNTLLFEHYRVLCALYNTEANARADIPADTTTFGVNRNLWQADQ